jgi:predicted phosphodiesterase
MIAIISDIHANLAALQAVLHDAKQYGCRQYICLGDIAGYHTEINECIEILSSIQRLVLIRGNHDQYLISNSGCQRSKHVTATLEYQREHITRENLEWLAKGQSYHLSDDTYFTHGGPRDNLEQYIYTVSESLYPDAFSRLVVGHTHVQIQLMIGRRTFCNPGSVGQPRDGDPRAAYAILQDEVIILRRIEYDILRTQTKMAAAGFPEFSYANLSLGAQIGGRIDSIKQLPLEHV